MQDKIKLVSEVLSQARFPVIMTGAGISAESGIPTFRGKDGLWKNYSAMELATPEAFNKNPEMVWEWYNYRKNIILNCKPNAGHYAITNLKKFIPHLVIITQNVDNLHRKAGLDFFYEMHGNIFEMRCLQCNSISINEETSKESLTCSKCHSKRVRPNVVWFSEPLPASIMPHILTAVSKADFFLSVGTSGSVYPAAGFAMQVRAQGGQVAIVNPEITEESSSRDIRIETTSGKALSTLAQLMEG